jgi:hypothetical protein
VFYHEDKVAGCTCRRGLASAHQDVQEAYPLPRFEGVHVVRGDLSQSPDSCPDVPYVFQGSFQPAGRFSRPRGT